MPPSLRERLETALARRLVGLPAPLIARAAGPPIVRDGRTLDPQVQLMLRLDRARTRLTGRPANPPVAQARAELEANSRVFAPPPRDLPVDALRVGGRPARRYRPRGLAAPAPTLVFFHGGGFVLGSLDSHDAPCRELAALADITVIAVDYRLAPEHRFPAAYDDALAAYRDVIARAGELGVDPRRVAVGGDSAGGNLAAGVAIAARADARPPAFQLLVYPAVDLTMSFPSVHELGEGFFLEEGTMHWFLDHYTPDRAARRDPRASPWFAEVRGVCPAFVQTAGFDPLRDEGNAYAAKLRAAGVAVEHREYASLFHGYLNTSGSIRSSVAPIADAAAALARALR